MKRLFKKVVTAILVATLALSLVPAIALADKSLTVSVQAVTFKDVKKTEWFYSHLEWGIEKGLITGYTDGTFRPNNNVRADEFLAMLMRSYAPTVKVAEAAKGANWADNYFKEAKRLGYHVVGINYADERGVNLDRGQVAVLIATSLGQKYTGDESVAVEFLLDNKLSDGKIKNGVKDFYPDDFLTRAEAIAFIKKVHDGLANGKVKINTQAPTVKAPIKDFEGFTKKVEELGFTTSVNDRGVEVNVKEGVMVRSLYNSAANTISIWKANEPNVVEATRILLEHVFEAEIDKDAFAKAINEINTNATDQTIKIGNKTVKMYVATTRYTITIDLE